MMALLEVLAEAGLVIGVLALVWNLASALEAWRYLRRRPVPRRPFALRIRFIRNQSTDHASKVQPCQILKFSTRK